MSNLRLPTLSSHQLARVKASQKYDKNRCPTCSNDGYFMYDGERIECDCRTQIRLQRAYLAAGIGSLYHTLDFDDFFEGFEDVAKEVRDYVDNFDDNLFYGLGVTFCGPLGTGKTFAASLILKEVIKKGHQGLFVSFEDLLDFQRRKWDDYSNQDFDEARNTEILVIDELSDAPPGRQRDFLASVLERIVRHRVNNNLPTILTTNISQKAEETSYPRVFSLLSSCQKRIAVSGDDQRRTSARQDAFNRKKKGERKPIA